MHGQRGTHVSHQATHTRRCRRRMHATWRCGRPCNCCLRTFLRRHKDQAPCRASPQELGKAVYAGGKRLLVRALHHYLARQRRQLVQCLLRRPLDGSTEPSPILLPVNSGGTHSTRGVSVQATQRSDCDCGVGARVAVRTIPKPSLLDAPCTTSLFVRDAQRTPSVRARPGDLRQLSLATCMGGTQTRGGRHAEHHNEGSQEPIQNSTDAHAGDDTA